MRRRFAGALALVVILGIALLVLVRRSGEGAGETEAPPARTAAPGSIQTPEQLERWRGIAARAAGRDPALPTRSLRGRVVDRDGQPVAGAEVVLGGTGTRVASASDGTFAFDGLTPGRYSVEARSAARRAGPRLVDLRSEDEVVLRLREGMIVEVEVVSAADDRPVAGAVVSLREGTMATGAGVHRAVTDARGIARLPGVELTNHDLMVTAPGFADYWAGPEFHERTDSTWRARVELSPGLEITGRVVREDGTPIAAALVEAKPMQEGYRPVDEDARRAATGAAHPAVVATRGQGAVTGADGRFRLGVAAGEWILVARSPGLEPRASEPVFADDRDRGPREVEIVLTTGAQLSGVVVTGDDEPVAAAEVVARWQAQEFVVQRSKTDGTGAFRLSGLPEAPLELIARSDAGASPPLRLDLSDPEVDREHLILQLSLVGSIEVTVVDGKGEPVPGAYVVYGEMPARGRPPQVRPGMETAGDDGRVVLRGLDRGRTYSITASRPQDGDLVRRTATAGARPGQQVTLRIPDDGRIVGRVVAERGRPVVGAVVRVPLGGGFARTGRDGRFALSAPPRRYRLRISGPGLADAYRDGVDVEEGETTDVGDIRVATGRSVGGTVLTPTGDRAVVATVRIEVDGRYALEVQTHDEGTFDTIAPDAATLRITASHQDHGDAAPIVIGPGESATGLRLQIVGGATIRGKATTSGMPAPDRPMLAWDASGARQPKPVRAALTDRDGSYKLANLPPGSYDVELLLPENPDQGLAIYVYRERVEVEGGQEIELDFDITDGKKGAVEMPAVDGDDIPTYAPSHGAEGDDHH